jgi:hypothetical protein
MDTEFGRIELQVALKLATAPARRVA